MSEIKISDHKATSELFFPHVEVIDWKSAVPPVRKNPLREKKRLLSEMDITKVTYNGQTIRIGVPRDVNMGMGCRPAALTVGESGHVGAHAKGIVKKVDWDKRMIEFNLDSAVEIIAVIIICRKERKVHKMWTVIESRLPDLFFTQWVKGDV